jgi:hypothetical protein
MTNEQMLIKLRTASLLGYTSPELKAKIDELDKRICEAHKK